MVNMTKVKLRRISDAAMYLFFEKDMRDRFSYISKRYDKASNQYLKFYDPKQKTKHAIYLEVNNLFGCAIFKFFPIEGFKWIDPEEFDWNEYSNNSPKDCVLEVDLEYPKVLR